MQQNGYPYNEARPLFATALEERRTLLRFGCDPFALRVQLREDRLALLLANVGGAGYPFERLPDGRYLLFGMPVILGRWVTPLAVGAIMRGQRDLLLAETVAARETPRATYRADEPPSYSM